MLNTAGTKNRTIPEKVAKPKSSPAGKRAAREILLLGVRAEVDLKNRERLAQALAGTVDWEYLLYLAEYHGVTPLLAHNLAQDEFKSYVPVPYSERLGRIYQNNIYRNMFLSDELGKVLSAFRRHGIEVITLKGIVLAEQLYVNPILRTTTDIDILVSDENILEAASLILEMGYTPSALPAEVSHPFHRVFYKKNRFPLMIELHWDLNDPKLINVPQSDIWRRARIQEFQGGAATVLSPEDTLLYVANNLLAQDGQQLKYLGDITEFLKINQDTLNWDLIIESAGSWGIIPTTYYSLKWARELLGARVPVLAMEALKPAVWKRRLVNLLMNNRTLCSPVKWSKLRYETLTLVRSLMMSRTDQSIAVLAKYRGEDKRFVWLRTIAWIPLVFGAALCLNAGKFLSRWK